MQLDRPAKRITLAVKKLSRKVFYSDFVPYQRMLPPSIAAYAVGCGSRRDSRALNLTKEPCEIVFCGNPIRDKPKPGCELLIIGRCFMDAFLPEAGYLKNFEQNIAFGLTCPLR